MTHRIIGFDLARAYAILGMFIVNFNMVYGDATSTEPWAQFLQLFNGNSSTVFVMLSGMGLGLMTARKQAQPAAVRAQLRAVVRKRSCFLFVLGLLLSLWWPADILHFYGGYMLLASMVLFADKRAYVALAAAVVLVFHLLLLVLPFETGWQFDTLAYPDFWTPAGFLRNFCYNGWNALLPWIAYFLVGMYLGKLSWEKTATRKRLFGFGLLLYTLTAATQWLVSHHSTDAELQAFFNADYLPPMLPFFLSTLGFGCMVIASFLWLGNRVGGHPLARHLAFTGQMTLTHYILHVTLGMLLFGGLQLLLNSASTPLPPQLILGAAVFYYIASVYFSAIWRQRFAQGPFESLMRKVAG